jgi:antirestriction protein ArdC
MTYPEPYGLECGAGWKDIIDRTHEKLKYIDPDYKIAQIKEKFGGLRYYFDPSFDYGSIQVDIMDDIVRAAEYEASITCELCGACGWGKEVELRIDRGYYYTYCKECSDKFVEERKSWLKPNED